MAANYSWHTNGSNLCYKDEDTNSQFCGRMGEESACIGMVLPIFFEEHWNPNFRAFLYVFGLLYSFLGISIVADIFMQAIEKITSKTRRIMIASSDNEPATEIEVPVWNGTVANLTLMALGSSAPEILLAIIGVIGNNFEADKLGPGTIVGSAAFNLLAISAVCIVGVPNGETRKIKNFTVFCVTAVFSVFAYFWLLVILIFNTKGVVDIWEASLTFLFFPILVLVAYAADKNFFFKSTKDLSDKQRQIELGNVQPAEGMLSNSEDYFKEGKVDKGRLVSFIRDIKKNTKLSDEDAAVIAASKVVDAQPKSRIWYRIGATRNLTGGRKINPGSQMSTKLREQGDMNPLSGDESVMKVYDAINEHEELPNIDYPDSDASKAIVEFHASSAAVMENIGTFKVLICRHGNKNSEVKVKVETIDGSAVEEEDYIKVDEVLTFNSMETEKEIGVTIVNDDQWEPDEEFFLKLSLVEGDDSKTVKLGRSSIMEIMILNDDEPGTFQFEKRGHLVKESVGEALISVVRQNGADGEVEVKWRTIDGKAKNGKDFVGGEGCLSFKHGETQRNIRIPITNDLEAERDENFEIELYEVSEGANLGKLKRTAVTITDDDEFQSVMNKLLLQVNANVDGMRVQNETWAQQLKDAMVVNGGDLENATIGDYVMHFLTFGFKLIFALIPPPGMMGGWLCFIVSLIMIGLLVIVVGDLAGIFGCLVGLKDEVTAITFVALGTSLPDTFASKSAAINEKYADNAVGNVTGSNSVNVFLGLGIPWLIAAIYHYANGNVFKVDPGSLAVSVTLYTICALIALLWLVARRFLSICGNAELGGPAVTKYISGGVFIGLWFIYVLISSLDAYDVIKF